MKKTNIIVAIIAVLVATSAITVGTYTNDRMMDKAASKMESKEMKDGAMNGDDMEDDAYALQFLSGIMYQPGQPSMLEFTVADKDGKRLTQDQYKINHEKRMHVIIASADLTHFRHVHPIFDTGTRSYKLPDFAFPAAGNYRIFTDFVVDSHNENEGSKNGSDMKMSDHAGVQYQDVIVGKPGVVQPLDGPTFAALADGNQVKLDVKPGESSTKKLLEFTITRDGKPVTDLQRLLGALGHLVVLRGGDLEYIHTHALSTDIDNQNGKVRFEVDFKQEEGTYRAFAQFQRDNKVMTTDFVVKID